MIERRPRDGRYGHLNVFSVRGSRLPARRFHLFRGMRIALRFLSPLLQCIGLCSARELGRFLPLYKGVPPLSGMLGLFYAKDSATALAANIRGRAIQTTRLFAFCLYPCAIV